MQKWVISADIRKYNHPFYFDRDGFIDWEQGQYKFEVNDIVYIYCKDPIRRVMYKTIVERINMDPKEAPDPQDFGDEVLIRLRLLKQVYREELSYENLKKIGFKAPQHPSKPNADITNYIEKYFEDDYNNMWMVRAGEEAFLIDEFKNKGIIAIGWGIGDIKNKSFDDIKNLLKENDDSDEGSSPGIAASMIYNFAHMFQKDDYVISAYPKDDKKYLMGKIKSDYFFDKEIIGDEVDIEGRYCKIRKVEWLCEFSSDGLSGSAKKTLLSGRTSYNIKEDVKNEILCFCKDVSFESEKRNIIFFGAPGTGKSYELDSKKNKLICSENDYERVTFHPDYSYANFVGTYKPVLNNDDISYEYVPGPFIRSLIKASKNPEKAFLLIIEEINRSNVAAVFGDVFQLLDRDKDYNSKYPIETSKDLRDYLDKQKEEGNLNEDFDTRRIRIPSNMFIWATMNSADQGVFPMDTAFKRRWDFKYIGIDDGQGKIEKIKVKLNNQIISWNDIRKAINDELLTYKLNEDKLMGPFFAYNEYLDEENDENESKDIIIEEEEFKEIFINKIIMYLFEDAAKSRRSDLFEGAKKDKSDNYVTYSRVREEFNKKYFAIFCENIQKKLDSKLKEVKSSTSVVDENQSGEDEVLDDSETI